MDEKQFMRVAKAIADPQRFEIFRIISGRKEISCGAIAELFPIQQSTVSHHLKALLDAELVTVRREGQHGFFTAKPDTLAKYIEQLQRTALPPALTNSTTLAAGN